MRLAGAFFAIAALVSGGSAQTSLDLRGIERARVLKAAEAFLVEPPLTVTSFPAPRSAGGPHDFFSEGDYWWPDPNNPGGPYIQRDGMTNPDNFVAHRHAMVRLSRGVASLAAAWKLTGDERYASHAATHLRSWFVSPATGMSPHLRYAQAIRGRATGRGTGIIDTIHLVEVARSALVLAGSRSLTPSDLESVRRWFADYLDWMTTHAYGIDERDARNNHATCWVMQVAAFAQLTRDSGRLKYCRDRFRTVLLPNQMAPDGSFPLELRRTKPYNYSLFNLDAMAMICAIASTPSDDLWTFALPDGRGMRRALEYMFPYIADKSRWPHPPDVMFFEFYPVRHPALLLGGLALKTPKYIDLWRKLEADPANEEVIRNFPIRQPLLWVETGDAPLFRNTPAERRPPFPAEIGERPQFEPDFPRTPPSREVSLEPAPDVICQGGSSRDSDPSSL